MGPTPEYETSTSSFNWWMLLFALLFLSKYLKIFVGAYTFLTYPSTLICANPKYSSRDVTVVIPTTFAEPLELATCIRNILGCRPNKLIVVTSKANLKALRSFVRSNGWINQVKCLGVKKLNKRKQILAALQKTATDIVCFADDDVFWPGSDFLDHMLACFEDPKVGAAGPRQSVRRTPNPSVVWFLGCGYLERRVWNNLTTMGIDGSISTLSGRTSLYRTEILRSKEFFNYFQTDRFLGRLLNSDDDKCLTRYVYSHDWNITIQGSVAIETTLAEDPAKLLNQQLRWSRARFRGNATVMCNERYWFAKHFWGLYVIYYGQFQIPVLALDSMMVGLLTKALGGSVFQPAVAALVTFVLAMKLIKMVPHFCRYPQDLKFAPLSILFSYVHGFIALYSILTLRHTAWGSQNLGDENAAQEFIDLKEHCFESKDDSDDELTEAVMVEAVDVRDFAVEEDPSIYSFYQDLKDETLVDVIELGSDDEDW